jgi:hypothetical protein
MRETKVKLTPAHLIDPAVIKQVLMEQGTPDNYAEDVSEKAALISSELAKENDQENQ